MKANELELQSKTINYLRFPLAVFVVFIHTDPAVDIQSVDYQNLNWNSLYHILGTLINNVVAGIAVPSFFMFSGYFFFYKIKEWNRSIYYSKIKGRINTLVLPYILFNIGAIIFDILLKYLKADGSMYPFLNELLNNWYRIFWNYTFWGDTNVNILGQQIPSYGPYLLPLWFLRDLIIMALISPIIYYFIKWGGFFGLVVIFLLHYSNIWIDIPGYSTRLFLTALFFFSIGAFFSLNKKTIVISLRKHQIAWLILSVFTMFLSTYYTGTDYSKFILPFFVLSGAITAINTTSYLMEHGKLRVRDTLSKASFFIYCLHGIFILEFTHMILRNGFKELLGADSILRRYATYLITPFACVGIILCIYLFMKRFMPRLLSLLTGGK